MNLLSKKSTIHYLFICITVCLFVLRVLFFASQLGSVEHDSGWYLGVAKNLAERGIYASYTNTIREEGIGAHPSIHGRFSVQDSNGFSYFPAGVTVGPGYVVPESILLKLFGNGWWQYRLWPLLCYTALLTILFYFVLQIGGILSLLFFQIWLWALPQITTQFAYESYSEPIALLYLLISFLFYYLAAKKEKLSMMFFAGLFVGFSLETKNLFLLPSLSFILPLLWEIWMHHKKLHMLFFRWVLFIIGISLPISLYEGYRYFFLVSHFGPSAWKAINQDLYLLFQSNGSGITNLNFSHLDPTFIMKKMNIWTDVGINYPFPLWILFLFSLPFVIRAANKQWRMIACMIYASVIISFIWFIVISPTGWARHAWQALILGMSIVSITLAQSFSLIKLTFRNILPLAVIIFGIGSLIRYESTQLTPFLNQNSVEIWHANQYIRGVEGLPSTPILSLTDQKGLINFFHSRIYSNDRVYFAGWFLNAEISPLVDKVFYTLDRYYTLGQANPDGGKSYLIFGPYQHGIWSLEPADYLPRKIALLCGIIVYQNPSYTLCVLRKGLAYDNPAY